MTKGPVWAYKSDFTVVKKSTMKDSTFPPLDTASKDRIYLSKEAESFVFGKDVAGAFDDMAGRSIPNYFELQLLICNLAIRYYQSNSAIYDLGCSTATSLVVIHKALGGLVDRMIGIDSSLPMLEKAKEKLKRFGLTGKVDLRQARLQELNFEPSSFIFANYTLQFLPEQDRAGILNKVFNSLLPDGVFLLSEKVEIADPHENRIATELYEDFKRRNGYSDMEIAKKRESLKGVLLPLTEEKNLKLLSDAGFTTVVPVLRGYGFQSWLCIKHTI